MYQVKISDSDGAFLKFDLRDILNLISDGNECSWVIKSSNFNIVEQNDYTKQMTENDLRLLELIENSNSFDISWQELVRIANLNIQTLDAEVIGLDKNRKIIIKAFDGSYWTIATNYLNLIERIESRFTDIEKEHI